MIVAAVLLVAVAVIIFIYFRSQIRATTMRILRMEGEVSLEDNGKKRTATKNLRLNSGNALTTKKKSLVAIGLDDTKIVTLDELSRAEFNQAGRQLDLELTDGSLFFEVQKPLEDDEKMEIKTNTMVVGIRGTSGWVSVEGDHESLIICDGHVHVIGRNPNTGETKEIEVYAGQRVSTYLYNDRNVDSIMFYVEEVTERELPEFLLERLRENPALLDKVCKETGWDKPWILGIDMLTPTPTPIVEEADDTDESDHDEVTPTPTPTTTPTAKKNDEDNTEEELEELLKKMLAMITPTPTPAPVITPDVPYEDPYGDEEEEEEEEKDNSVTAVYNHIDGTNGPFTLTNGAEGTFNEYPGSQSGIINITKAGSTPIVLPLNITNNNGQVQYQDLQVGSNKWIDWTASAYSNGNTMNQSYSVDSNYAIGKNDTSVIAPNNLTLNPPETIWYEVHDQNTLADYEFNQTDFDAWFAQAYP